MSWLWSQLRQFLGARPQRSLSRPFSLHLEALEERTVPSLASVAPLWAIAGGPAFTLSLHGDHFASNSTVQWNGQSLNTTFVSDTDLRATVPASDLALAGPAYVAVVTPGAGATNVKGFAVLPHENLAASVTGAFPASTLFEVTVDGALFRRNITGWQQIGGAGSILGISATEPSGGLQAAEDTLFAVTTDHALFQYTFTRGWQQLGGKGTIAYVSAGLDEKGAADVWVITTDLSATRWSGSAGWYASPVGAAGTVANVHANATGGVTVVTTDGRDNFYGIAPGSQASAPSWGSSNAPAYGLRDFQSIYLGQGARGPMYNELELDTDSSLTLVNINEENEIFVPNADSNVRSIGADLQDGYWLRMNGQLMELNPNGTSGAALNAPGTVTDFTPGGQGRVFALLSDGTVWQHDPTGWTTLGMPS